METVNGAHVPDGTITADERRDTRHVAAAAVAAGMTRIADSVSNGMSAAAPSRTGARRAREAIARVHEMTKEVSVAAAAARSPRTSRESPVCYLWYGHVYRGWVSR